jgi:Fe2+ transport system protein FeoA
MQYHHVAHPFKPACVEQPAPLTAELSGSDTAIACGITVRSCSPVLALCRRLIVAGMNPDAALTVHRRGLVAPVLARRQGREACH